MRALHIFVASKAGAPMEERAAVRAFAGAGHYGDRYATNDGAWSKARSAIRHASLVAIEAIHAANAELWQAFTPAETLRNIVTEGVEW